MPSKPTKLTEDEIATRIKIGKRFLRKFAANDRQASRKFRDSSVTSDFWFSDVDDNDEWSNEEGADVPADTPIGQSNQLATNILTKCAALAYGNPDWAVTCKNADNQTIVRTFLREKWRLHDWVKLSQQVVQKNCLIGLGWLAYRWDDEKRSTFEFVQNWDLSINPHTQNLTELSYASRRIFLPLREAIDRFGKDNFPGSTGKDDGSLDRERVEIWIYYDKDSEIYQTIDGKTLNPKNNENHYGRVPFICLEGENDPGKSIFPLGDSQLASGLQAELSDLNQIISRNAKHGGSFNLVDVRRLGKDGVAALEDGVLNGFIPVDDLITPPVAKIEGVELSPVLLEAKREASQALDGAQGATQYDRGVISQSAKFATEAALAQNKSGARGVQGRGKFEKFLNKMAEVVIMLEVEFGGPRPGHTTDEEYVLWEALSDVTEIYVIENSTSAKDPAQESQNALMLLNTVAQLTPLFLQTQQPQVPNLEQYVNDYLRASGHQDVSRYWTSMQQQQPQQPQQPGQPQPQPGQEQPQGMPPQGMPTQG